MALPFPPFPDCWIAFAEQDDGTAIEVYPTTNVLEAGLEQISCEIKAPNPSSIFYNRASFPQPTRLSLFSKTEAECAARKGRRQDR